MTELVLGSGSPRRRELLERAGFMFEVVPSDVDETMDAGLSVYDAVVALALRKAHGTRLLLEADDMRPIVACDTVVVLDGEVLGKPRDEEDAVSMLMRLSGRSHEVVSGVCVMNGIPRSFGFSEVTRVTFRELTEDEIRAYVATGEPMDKAGAYAIQGGAAAFVESYEGDYDNIVGLPVARLVAELESQGVHI